MDIDFTWPAADDQLAGLRHARAVFDAQVLMRLTGALDLQPCGRCGKLHLAGPVDIDAIVDDASHRLADAIDARALALYSALGT